jgi:hypothetical protein
MRKKYVAPVIELDSMENENALLIVSSQKGIGYGGVDTDGSKDPDARAFDFEDEE